MDELGGVPIKRYPTRLHVRCQLCGHQGTVSVFLDQAPRLKCSKCGNKHPVIDQRDGMRKMKRSRRPDAKSPWGSPWGRTG